MVEKLVRRHFFCLLSVPYLDHEEIKLCKKFPYSFSIRLPFHMPGSYHLTIFRLVVPASGELPSIYLKDLGENLTSNTYIITHSTFYNS